MDFDWYEYVGIIAVLITSVALIFLTKRQKQSEAPVLTDRMSLTPIAVSLIVSNTSGVTLLAKPAESYKYGIDFFVTSSLFNFIIIALTHGLFSTVLHRLKGDSIYEYFEKRFGRSIKNLTMTIFIISQICGTSIVVLPPAIVLNQFSGLPVGLIIVLLLSLTTFYTALGGYSGVVWTDAFQGAIMFAAMSTLALISVGGVGEPSRVWSLARDSDRIRFPELIVDPTARLSIWTYLHAVSGLTVVTLNQSTFQRYKSLSNKRDMVWSLWLQYSGTVFLQFCATVIGLAVYAYYEGCDPKSAKIVNSYENIIVYWINDVGKVVKGLRGVYVAAITCASISTISTHINSCAGLIAKEGIMRLVKIDGTRKFNRWLKLSTIFVGSLATFMAVCLRGTRSLLELRYCLSAVEGIASGFFVLGVLCVQANTKGTLISGFVSLLLTLAMTAGSEINRAQGLITPTPTKRLRTDLCPFNVTAPSISDEAMLETNETVFYLFRISPFLIMPLGAFSTIILGYLISLAFRDDESTIKVQDPDLYSPLVHKFLTRLPGKQRYELGSTAKPFLPEEPVK